MQGRFASFGDLSSAKPAVYGLETISSAAIYLVVMVCYKKKPTDFTVLAITKPFTAAISSLTRIIHEEG